MAVANFNKALFELLSKNSNTQTAFNLLELAINQLE
jgi:predicted oxidoreductase